MLKPRSLLCLIFLAPCLLASQPEEVMGHGQVQQLHQLLKIQPGATLIVDNPLGNLRIRSIREREGIDVTATVQLKTGQDNPLDLVQQIEEDGSVKVALSGIEDMERLVRAVYRVDLVIGLPDTHPLDVRLIDGEFTMHGGTYPVRLRGRTGKANIRTSGTVDVELLHGHVVYQPAISMGAPQGGRIQTSSAAVDVLLADPESLNYQVVSGAAITTDSLALLQSRQIDGRTRLFGSDADSPVLKIQTDHGPVRLVAEGIR